MDTTRFCSLLPRSRRPGNEYLIVGDEAIISLNDGHMARIDATDIPRVVAYRWRTIAVNHTIYVVTTTTQRRRLCTYYLHRLVTDAPTGITVDHKDRDPLNNRRGNLRLVPQWENCQNRTRVARSSTGIQGVGVTRLHRPNGTTYEYYRASIKINSRRFARCFPLTTEGLQAAADFVASVRAEHVPPIGQVRP